VNKYVDLWCWIFEVFGDQSFKVDQFQAEFPGPDLAKVIRDLLKLNMITRVRTGVYKPTPPLDFARMMVEQNMSKEKLLTSAPALFAYSHDDAVRIWTDGYYWTGFTAGYKPVHIEIRKADQRRWQDFFRRNGASYTFEGDRKTLFGLVFILHPVSQVRSETRDGVPVIPLVKVIEYCKDGRGVYEPAMTYLRKKFGAIPSRACSLSELRGVFKNREKAVREGIRELEREHRKEARE
jgi:hypothetical protein